MNCSNLFPPIDAHTLGLTQAQLREKYGLPGQAINIAEWLPVARAVPAQFGLVIRREHGKLTWMLHGQRCERTLSANGI